MNRQQHAAIDPVKVRKLLKLADTSQAELTSAMGKLSVRHFRLDRHGPGKTSANLDTLGALCKVLRCTPNDVVSMVGIKKEGLSSIGKQ